jgi:hypothetical protein
MTKVESADTIPEIVFKTEKRDEEQIIMEMKNQLVDTWVYRINVHGREVTSLSYAGVKEAVRKRGNFRFQPCSCCGKTVHVDEDSKEYHAQVTVHDENRNVMFIGAAAAFKDQPFAWVLAVNKAERNAFRKMLPEKAIALLIEQYLRNGSSKPQSVPTGKLA